MVSLSRTVPRLLLDEVLHLCLIHSQGLSNFCDLSSQLLWILQAVLTACTWPDPQRDRDGLSHVSSQPIVFEDSIVHDIAPSKAVCQVRKQEQ